MNIKMYGYLDSHKNISDIYVWCRQTMDKLLKSEAGIKLHNNYNLLIRYLSHSSSDSNNISRNNI